MSSYRLRQRGNAYRLKESLFEDNYRTGSGNGVCSGRVESENKFLGFCAPHRARPCQEHDMTYLRFFSMKCI